MILFETQECLIERYNNIVYLKIDAFESSETYILEIFCGKSRKTLATIDITDYILNISKDSKKLANYIYTRTFTQDFLSEFFDAPEFWKIIVYIQDFRNVYFKGFNDVRLTNFYRDGESIKVEFAYDDSDDCSFEQKIPVLINPNKNICHQVFTGLSDVTHSKLKRKYYTNPKKINGHKDLWCEVSLEPDFSGFVLYKNSEPVYTYSERNNFIKEDEQLSFLAIYKCYIRYEKILKRKIREMYGH